jgi:signal peptidase
MGIKSKLNTIGYIALIIVALIISQHLNVVVSGSMEPVMYRGDIVAIEQVNFFSLKEFNTDNIRVGDIVVYNSEWFSGGPIIHRVINVTETNGTKLFTIKGDNNPIQDPLPVRPSQIISRVLTIGDHPVIIPKIGYITIYIKEFTSNLLGIPTVSS